jgi:protein SCO1/2
VRRWYAISVAAAAIVGIAVGVFLHNELVGGAAQARGPVVPALHGQATWAPGARAAPGFVLRDQHGHRVTLGSLRGRSIALLFMDSLCKEACPLEGRMIAAAVRGVPAALRPQLVVVSVDPAGDTPRTIAIAAHKWRLPASVEWLLGTHKQLAKVWRDYQITVAATSGDVVHSTAVYLIDRHGDERAGFLLPFVPALVADDLRILGKNEGS